MEWDQKLFQVVHNWFRKAREKEVDPAILQRQVKLSELEERLEILAKALTGRPIHIKEAEREGGGIGHVFFLPRSMSLFSSSSLNLEFYLFRVAFLSMQLILELQQLPPALRGSSHRHLPPEMTLQILRAIKEQWSGMNESIRSLFAEVEAIPEEEGQLPAKHWLSGRLISPSFLEGGDVYSPDYYEPDPEDEEEKLPTELKAKPREEIESLQVDSKTIEDYTLLHQFEKIETLDEFNGRWRDMDGDDDLADHSEALQELDLRQTVRTDIATHSVLQADLMMQSLIPESEEAQEVGISVTYPEWDYKKREYKEDFCRVFEQTMDQRNPEYVRRTKHEYRQTLQQMRRKLARFRQEREWVRRQPDGEMLDLDAVVEGYADRMAGRTPSEHMYLSRRPKRRNTAVLVLMDVSLSTDAFTDNRRILDVEKQAILLFGDLLEENGEHFQIDAFSSRTRNYCHYFPLKSFGESWKERAPVIAGVQPVGYTRIGPALRHAIAQLEKEPCLQKWILLLSDGKPNDYDRYEGSYGVQDVRQAIREAAKKHIHLYALAIEKEARHYLPQMLGKSNYRILPHPEALPDALLYFYTRLQSR